MCILCKTVYLDIYQIIQMCQLQNRPLIVALMYAFGALEQ